MSLFSQYSHEQLVALLRQDNEPAFEELYDRFWHLLFTKAYNFLRHEDTAKDCVQEIFVSIWQNRHTLQIENVHNYLHQAVRFQSLKAIKERKAVVGLEERLVQFTHTVLQTNDLQYKELKAAFQSLLATLPEDQQEMFLMNREQGLTYKQIAEIKNISVKTVEKKMSLALKTLRPGLDKAFVLFITSAFIH